MNVKPQFHRRGKQIIDLRDDAQIANAANEALRDSQSRIYQSLNAARKASHRIQMQANGKIGIGTLRVVA